jgi:hypothetical protein
VFPVEEFRDSVSSIADIFVGLSIRFHLTGGAATIAYSEPRLTQDIDVVVDRVQLSLHVTEFIQAVDSAGFTFEEAAVKRAIADGKSFQLLDLKRILKIDLYPRELIAGELDRTVQLPVFAGVLIPVVSIQDLILSKLIWISHGSGKSRADLRGLWKKTTAEQQADVRRYTIQHRLAKLLDEVLSESDEIDV